MGPSMQALQASCQESEKPKLSPWPDWTNQTAVCVATGASLNAEDIAHIGSKARVIAINGAGLVRYLPLSIPTADILYAADRAWWQHYNPTFSGLRVSGEPVNGIDTIPLKMLERDEPMAREPGTVVSAGHSGFQALGLALTLGAKRVLLLGYDCKAGRAHDRPEQFNRQGPYEQWAQAYNRVPKEWPDVEIINCTRDSAITAFPMATIQATL